MNIIKAIQGIRLDRKFENKYGTEAEILKCCTRKELLNKINLAASNFNKYKLDKFKTQWYKLIHEFYKYTKPKRSKTIKKDS